MPACFECGHTATEHHHVVPAALGGKRTVPLCTKCHSLVHGLGNRGNISALTKLGIEKARARGVKIGRPFVISDEVRDRIFSMRESGASLAKIADALNGDGVPTANVGSKWWPNTISHVLKTRA